MHVEGKKRMLEKSAVRNSSLIVMAKPRRTCRVSSAPSYLTSSEPSTLSSLSWHWSRDPKPSAPETLRASAPLPAHHSPVVRYYPSASLQHPKSCTEISMTRSGLNILKSRIILSLRIFLFFKISYRYKRCFGQISSPFLPCNLLPIPTFVFSTNSITFP